MVIFIGLFQTVRLSKWYLHFDTPSNDSKGLRLEVCQSYS